MSTPHSRSPGRQATVRSGTDRAGIDQAMASRGSRGMLVAWAVAGALNLTVVVLRLLDAQRRWGFPTVVAVLLLTLCILQVTLNARRLRVDRPTIHRSHADRPSPQSHSPGHDGLHRSSLQNPREADTEERAR